MLNVLSLGAGVQSSTVALMAAHGEIERIDAAIFADTQNEPVSVMRWLDWLEQEVAKCKYPFPIHRVTIGNLADNVLRVRTSASSGRRYMTGGIPAFLKKEGKKEGILGRTCTENFKIKPVYTKIRKILGIQRISKKMGVVCRVAIGISMDEYFRVKPNKFRFAESYWPLIDKNMTRADCLAWMQAKGYPTPPRSACVFCPFHSDDDWIKLKTEEPEGFARAVEFERKMHTAYESQDALHSRPYLHSTCVPLDEVKFNGVKVHSQVDLFGNECEGLCGV